MSTTATTIVVAVMMAMACACAVAGAPHPRPRDPPPAPTPAVCSAIPANKRVNCGSFRLNASQCLASGCCASGLDLGNGTDATGAPSCFYTTAGTPVKKVALIQSNHFDAGYASYTTDVLNMYIGPDGYFNLAADVGNATAVQYPDGKYKLRWMTQAYILSFFFDCPPGMGLQCPTPELQAKVRNAIHQGWITWHAFPHNSHTETARPEMLRSGIEQVHALDDMFGLPHKRILSQRDVPGMPRAILPVLQSRNITGVSIGANGRMQAVPLPPAFIWQDQASSKAELPPLLRSHGTQADGSTSMLVLFHPKGYGQMGDGFNNAQLPGFDQAVVYAWRGDNAGPCPTVKDVVSDFENAQKMFPGAEVVSSSLEEFFADVEAAGDAALAGLPTRNWDWGNTWNIGDQQDPLKAAVGRALDRVHGRCKDSGCGASPTQAANFSRQVIKNCEHTFGMSIGNFGKYGEEDWTNEEFESDLAANSSSFVRVQGSFEEQRNYGLWWPMDAIAGTPYAAAAQAEIDEWRNASQVPSTSGSAPADISKTVKLGPFSLEFDQTTGAATTLNGHAGAFGNVTYQTLNDNDFLFYYRAQFLTGVLDGRNEYGKQNCGANISESRLWAPALSAAFIDASSRRLVVEATLDAQLHTKYGAPTKIYTVYTVEDGGGVAVPTLNITVVAENKIATRIPEALYVSFLLAGADHALVEVMGEWTDTMGETIAYGARGLRGVTDGFGFTKGNTGMYVRTVDAGLVKIGELLAPFPNPALEQPEALEHGMSVVVHANSWSTNFPLWYPFQGGAEQTPAEDGRPQTTIGWRFQVRVDPA